MIVNSPTDLRIVNFQKLRSCSGYPLSEQEWYLAFYLLYCNPGYCIRKAICDLCLSPLMSNLLSWNKFFGFNIVFECFYSQYKYISWYRFAINSHISCNFHFLNLQAQFMSGHRSQIHTLAMNNLYNSIYLETHVNMICNAWWSVWGK